MHRYVGPAQQRYGEYFCGVLFNPTLQPPSEITKMLRRIVFSPFDFVTLAAADPTLDGVWDSDDPAPFLVVYQHSKSVWAGPSETHVSYCERPVICKDSRITLCQAFVSIIGAQVAG